jgi:ankyrin repeat protein
MATNKRKRKTKPKDASLIISTSSMVRLMRRGTVSILEAVAEELPDVFTAEILPKLDLRATLSLAHVNKWYNDAVWSVDGVRSFEAKLRANLVNTNRPKFPMYWATKQGNLPAVRALLKSGVDANVNMNLKSGFRALHVAAKKGYTALVKTLIGAGADVDFRARLPVVRKKVLMSMAIYTEGKTPLYLAAENGATLAVIELLKAGADVDQAEYFTGKTPLLIAAEKGMDNCVSLLIYAGADVDWIDDSGNTAMSLVLANCKIMKLLKEAVRVKRACA